jgi:hypothetical protein
VHELVLPERTAAIERQSSALRYVPTQAVCESRQSHDFIACEAAEAAPELGAPAGTCTNMHTQGGTQQQPCPDRAGAAEEAAALENGSDTQQAPGSYEAEQKRLRSLEVQHVHRVYEAIAPHFSATRCAVR